MKTVCITGASSGIGWASALALAERNPGLHLMLGARRQDRLHQLASLIKEKHGNKVNCAPLDLASDSSVHAFALATLEHLDGHVDILLNNGGGAHGLAPVVDGDARDWRTMMDVNFYGTLLLTKQLLPAMIARKSGHIINLGSIAGQNVYEGGAVYCASKHALSALTRTLKLELNGTGIRVSSIDPGMVETEFSLVRFKGDNAKAEKVYQGLEPLSAEDIADCVAFVAMAPSHVNIDQIVITPTAQATVYKTHRT